MKFGILLGLLTLTQCVHQGNFPSDSIKIRFQNMVGLELGQAGCSILNYGGLDRMCEYSNSHIIPDLFMQVGPAFTQVTTSDMTVDLPSLKAHREILWKEWQRLGVRFYSVSGRDLYPSLGQFNEVTKSGGISRISSNILAKDKTLLFEPYFLANIRGVKLVFLSFADPKESVTGADWAIGDLETSFRSIMSKIPDVSAIHIVGSLTKVSRERLEQISPKPILFIGGELSERNTTAMKQISSRSFWIKAPDVGRGLGEIEISQSLEGKGVNFAGLNYRYKAILLPKPTEMSPQCTSITEEKKSCTPL